MLKLYTVEHWTISGVHTGYRVIRWWPSGQYHVAGAFVGDCYKPGSFAEALRSAEALANELNANARMVS